MDALNLVRIKVTTDETSTLELPKDQPLSSFRSGNYQVLAGTRKSLVKLAVQKGSSFEGTFYINENVLKNLLIPEGIKINLKISNGKIHIGPILGVFISENKVEKLKNGGWDSVYWRFQNWASYYGGLVYFFTLQGTYWYEGKVKGYCWTSDKQWVHRFYPIPQIIYDRCFGAEGRQAAYKLRDLIHSSGIRVYNNVVKIGKYETYQHLQQYPEIKDCVPKFYDFNEENLKICLEQYGSLYLKPDKLYKGEGVLRVSKNGEKYTVEHRQPEKNNVFCFQEIDEMLAFLKTLFKQEQDYIIQNEIQLASFLGNKFDVRVMLQKMPNSNWEVTGINSRIAPIGSVITSPRSGGKVLRIREVLEKCFPGKEMEIIEKIITFSKSVGYKLEEKFGTLGELGVDLGIDQNGKVWLIEVNGKPLKVSFFKMKDKVINKVINLSPIQFGMAQDWFHITFDREISHFSPENYQLQNITDGSIERFIYLNDQQLEAFKLYPGRKLWLQVGPSSFSVEVKKQTSDLNATNIYLSDIAFQELTHYHGELLSLILASPNAIVLGPMVGMTVSDKTIELLSEIYEMKKLSQLALEKGVFFYCFCLDHVDWENKQVDAFYFNPQSSQWENKALPYPQVLYDMATYPFDLDKRQIAKEANRLLRKNPDLQPINSVRFFGKWQTYKAVTFFDKGKTCVPNSELLTPLTLQKFLSLNKRSFVKSNYGSFGKEVFRVEKEGKHFNCSTGGEKVEKWSFYNVVSLYLFLVDELGSNCIIQEAVNLSKIDDRIFDMRVLAQKNLNGNWVISTINFRIAPDGAVVTNYAAGAQEVVVAPNDELPHPLLTWKKVTEFSREMLLALEATFGNLGEVGLDVALDDDGKLWLLEANSKPNTIGYNEVTTEEVLSQVHGLPLDYAKHMIIRMYNNITI